MLNIGKKRTLDFKKKKKKKKKFKQQKKKKKKHFDHAYTLKFAE